MSDIRFLLNTHYSKNSALIIGINNYKNVTPLGYAVSDAKEIKDILIDELDFPTENVTYLVDEDATKTNILKAFMSFSNADLDEKIFIFFAGHGHTVEGFRGDVGFLVPYDAEMNDLSTLIRWEELTHNSEIIKAKHMFFIMDACYGGLALTRSPSSGSTRFLKDMMKRYSRQVLTAGKANEVVADSGGPIPNHSVFTGHLIEGIRGKAANQDGVITANGLMAYVGNKVANDKNSNQTPHYGYFDGDGDFIIKTPNLENLEGETVDLDKLIIIPFAEQEQVRDSTEFKIKSIKSLLSNDSLSIELHDFSIKEVQKFLSKSSEDYFKPHGNVTKELVLERISKYEEISHDLLCSLACIAYWAKPIHKSLLQKIISRSSDRLEMEGGSVVLINLRWYPLILEAYYAGISAVESKNYDALAAIFMTEGLSNTDSREDKYFIEKIARSISNLHDAFKALPGYERNYVPMSEYLYKIIQPKLDDTLYIGKGYERSYDEFEILLALVHADIQSKDNGHVWGPIGRFGWKHKRHSSPFNELIEKAKLEKENWGPVKSGLFEGKVERFLEVAEKYKANLDGLHWY
ncbi:caspase family protein [Methylotenera sp.]|uniref:caspase family protein n=1 Tax=Methylotenera sp. TaxID=2051956 RepID=UPI002733186E|nr:caspase family protein [Methylotenera sp.]MDP3776462.1 caspase family protein [Methylotenera sp.]